MRVVVILIVNGELLVQYMAGLVDVCPSESMVMVQSNPMVLPELPKQLDELIFETGWLSMLPAPPRKLQTVVLHVVALGREKSR